MVIGWLVVACYAALILVATVTTEDADLPPGARADDGTAAEAFIASWERAGNATFVRTGTFERRSEVTGSSISSEDVLAQRPPQRLHRQLGGVSGRDDQRLLLCPSAPDGDPRRTSAPSASRPARPTKRTWRARWPPWARCSRAPPRCTAWRRPPRAAASTSSSSASSRARRLGTEATFCFDPATGAPTNSRVAYEGGIVEVVAVTGLRGEVSDEDLEP